MRPTSGGGQSVSWTLASIERSPAHSPKPAGTIGRLKIEVRVLVPRLEKPVDIALEFGSRRRERDDALHVLASRGAGAASDGLTAAEVARVRPDEPGPEPSLGWRA